MNDSLTPRKRRPVTTAIVTLLLMLFAGTAGMALLSLTAVRPANLGVRDGRLASCPDSPNCVCTQAEDRDHWIAPLTLPDNSPPAIELLAAIVREMPRTKVVTQTVDYLHVEFRSQLFRFCDDVEFFAEPGSTRVHFRSASRSGRSDLGVNRERMELIRMKLQEAIRAAQSGVPQTGWVNPLREALIS